MITQRLRLQAPEVVQRGDCPFDNWSCNGPLSISCDFEFAAQWEAQGLSARLVSLDQVRVSLGHTTYPCRRLVCQVVTRVLRKMYSSAEGPPSC